jgi:hypothetical protein
VVDRGLKSTVPVYLMKWMEGNMRKRLKISGQESQGAWHQGELIGGKPTIIK